jgi:nucleotide-binding universal stress UspA family protein
MRGGLRRILHPTDFSPASRPAFDQAVALAGRPGAQLIVLNDGATIPFVGDWRQNPFGLAPWAEPREV